MRKILITFSGAPYDETTKMIVDKAKEFGADELYVYDDAWLIKQPFYAQNQWLWQHHHKRGFGWYAWKPFIIQDALTRFAKDGDVIMFIDADAVPIADFTILYKLAEVEEVMLFAANGWRQFQWCKRDCYIIMNQDEEKYRDVPAGVARFMLFKKGSWMATQFLMEWLTYCVNEKATTFDPSVLGPELPGFREHRTEQAIMSNLSYKYDIKLYRECCDAGEYPVQSGQHLQDRNLYGQLFQQINPHKEKVTAEVIGSKYANV